MSEISETTTTIEPVTEVSRFSSEPGQRARLVIADDHVLLLDGLKRLLENDFELAAFAFHVEAVFIAGVEEAALEFIESIGTFLLKIALIEHRASVHETRLRGQARDAS